MPIDLEITMKLSKQLADQASREFHADEKKRIKQTAEAVDVAEKAKTAIANREIKQRIDAIVKAHKTEIDLANAAAKAKADAEKRASKDAATAAKDAATAAKDAEKAKAASINASANLDRMARADKLREERRVAAEVASLLRTVEKEKRTEARETSKEEARLYREYQKRMQENAREVRTENKLKAAESKSVFEQYKAAWNDQDGAINSALTSVASFGTAMVGLGSVSAVIGEIDGAFQRTRDTVYNSVNLLHDFQETLLELAALKGNMGDATGESLAALRFQAKTGQKSDDARALQTAFLGSGEVAIGKNIARPEAMKAIEGIGRLQAVEGGSAEAYGKLTGFLMQTMKPQDGRSLKSEEVTKEAAAMFALQQPGGFQNMGSAMNAFGQTMPYVKSGIMSGREAMGMASAFSLTEEGEAGTRVDQLTRATIGSTGRNRKVKGVEGSNNVGTADYLKSLGAKNEMGVMGITKLIAADLAKFKGNEEEQYSYLQSKGYGNQADLKAVVGMSAMINDGTWGKTFAPMIGDKNLGAGVAENVEGKLASEPLFQGRMSKAAESAANMAAGMGPEGVMQSMRRSAYAKMKLTDKSLPGFEEIDKMSPLNPSNVLFGYKERLENATQDMLMEQADARGIGYQSSSELKGVNGLLNIEAPGVRKDISQSEQYRVARELGNQGFNVGGDAINKIADAMEKSARASGLLIDRFGTAPAMDGKPAQPRANPGGGID